MKVQKSIGTDKLVSVSEYAKLIGKTTQRVYQLIDAKKVNAIRIGANVFIIKDR